MRGIGYLRQKQFHRRLSRSGVTLGEGAHVSLGSRIECVATIGDHSRVNGPIRMGGAGPISVGKYCAIGSDVAMLTSNHDLRSANVQVALNRSLGLHSLVVSAPIQVMNNVWIGDRVILLPGVTVGDGAVLGAGCIVTKDVPPFAVAIGNPGRVVRSRFSPDVVEALLQIAWWDWATDRIARNGEFLSADLTGMSGSDLMRLVKD